MEVTQVSSLTVVRTVVVAGCYGNKGCNLGPEPGLAQSLYGFRIGLCRPLNFSPSLEGTTPVCEDIARSLLSYGRRIPLTEWESRIAVIGPLEESLEPWASGPPQHWSWNLIKQKMFP